jgi:threonine aldolase
MKPFATQNGEVVDLRSDTVTKPTIEMREAMANAVVGDDRYHEDPTVAELEAYYAELVGKEAALFVPSGTMANQVAMRTWTSPGDVVLAGARQHVLQYERMGSAINSGVQIVPVRDDRGTLSVRELEEQRDIFQFLGLPVKVVCVENTHMPAGGVPIGLEVLKEIRSLFPEAKIHMDGARLFNASVATGIEPSEYAQHVDSVMSCVSKGLGAPVGSLLGGSKEFIENAWKERAILGGQMRQAGVLAAAGLVALQSMRDRLAEDHRRARKLAKAIAARYGLEVLDPDSVQTNIVVFSHPDPEAFLTHLSQADVLGGSVAPGYVRLVTHKDVDDEMIDRTIVAISKAP